MAVRARLFFFSSRRRHTRCLSDWSSDVCSSDLSGVQFGHPTSVLTLPPTPDDVRRGAKPACGSWGQRVGQNMVFVAGDVPIQALVQMLAFRLGGVRVLDQTGVTDRFNFFLEFAI